MKAFFSLALRSFCASEAHRIDVVEWKAMSQTTQKASLKGQALIIDI
jgi:hypothetical protein